MGAWRASRTELKEQREGPPGGPFPQERPGEHPEEPVEPFADVAEGEARVVVGDTRRQHLVHPAGAGHVVREFVSVLEPHPRAVVLRGGDLGTRSGENEG